VEFEEHVTTGINHISQTGNKKLKIYTISGRRKFFILGNHDQWSFPEFSLGTIVVLSSFT
jgi:hypothetical protein